MRSAILASVIAVLTGTASGQTPGAKPLERTTPLALEEPLDVVMVRGINKFAEDEIGLSRARREAFWKRDFSSLGAYEKSIAGNRRRLRTIIGIVDDGTAATSDQEFVGEVSPEGDSVDRAFIRRALFDDVDAEFYSVMSGDLDPTVIIVPDSAWSPEQMTGEMEGLPEQAQLARRLRGHSIGSLIVPLANRSDEFSGRPGIRFTNQSHREYLYRPAFELGRHIIGYEVQKILRAVDALDETRPVVVWGVGDGGLLAMYAAAIDPRVGMCVVSGYFNEREQVWKEPIDRNVWGLLSEFGDANIASLISPRAIVIEACSASEVKGPIVPSQGRAGAAPGVIATPSLDSVAREFNRLKVIDDKVSSLGPKGSGIHAQLVVSGSDGQGLCGSTEAMQLVLHALSRTNSVERPISLPRIPANKVAERRSAQQHRLVEDLRRHTQRLLHAAAKKRDELWSKADRSSLAAWEETQEKYRDLVYDELIGRIPYSLLPPNVRSRQVIDEPTHTGHEVVMDVFKSEADGSQPIIAGGILLLPKDLKPGEKRPCVVCQHGLEGTPMDTITTDPKSSGYGPYKGFSTQLVQRGFIVYAPQNPYRGKDEFRVIQRKSNPLGRSLFSYIIPQHQQTLNWLATLPFIDADRIGFYGLSYGGKTAMRVPPMLPPRPAREGQPAQPGYCLSICSADFNEWIMKNASTEDRYSYVFTNEYEIFEWNMGHVANYAELASLMTPRPFMVERGHDDGVASDEWVAWEFAKVKRHYDKLGIGDRTELEVFNGPHTINGKGTFDFLHRHLNWPKPSK
jgi:cephalosporin-C deacetylase-like acetyl esterase